MANNIKETIGDSSAWLYDRLGLCIFWGLYSLGARHEWLQSNEEMSDGLYAKYFNHFDPDLYDPVSWARIAKNAGIRYVLICTKHHDGFCLWDTSTTDFKVTNTPFGKDVLTPMVKAFRDEGLAIYFYFSLIDWHHSEFPVDKFHPMRNNQEFIEKNRGRNIDNYIPVLFKQVEELLTQFGQIDMFFPDFSYPGENGKGRNDWQSEELVKFVRKLQPNILINDRLDLLHTSWGWDFRTPEQIVPRHWPIVANEHVYWETYQTFSGSWGYHRDEFTWKSIEQCIQLLIETVSKGGNLTFNVGPTARGEFDSRAMHLLSGIGEWMKNHSRAIYGCTQAPKWIKVPEDCLLTFNPITNRLYVHVLAWPNGVLHLDGLAGKVNYSQLLNDASEIIPFQTDIPNNELLIGLSPNTCSLALPIKKPDVVVPVIELFLNK